MFTATISFYVPESLDLAEAADIVLGASGGFYQSGQICPGETPTVVSEDRNLVMWVRIPDATALRPENNDKFANNSLQRLQEYGLGKMQVEILGRDLNMPAACTCTDRSWQVLSTTLFERCSPLKCGDCFRPIPIYTVPAKSGSNHFDLVSWQAQWQALDRLSTAATLEKTVDPMLADIKNPLNEDGREIVKALESRQAIPTFYSLFVPMNENMKHTRTCVSCGSDWKLKKPLHRVFDYKCTPCRLLSNNCFKDWAPDGKTFD